MEIVAGNGQGGPAYGVAPTPLRVALRHANQRPFRGGEVSWRVSLGEATVAPATSISDANGEATAVVTLGGDGPVRVEARAAGLDMVVAFDLVSIPRCFYLAPFRVDTTVSGELADPDCQFSDATYVDFYRLPSNNAAVRLTMQATFDAFVLLYAYSGAIVAFDDDGGGGTSAGLKAILPTGVFVAGANSAIPATGSYSLTATALPRTISGCEMVWVVGALTFSEGISASDCAGTYYADLLLMVIYRGQRMSVTLTSAEFSPRLELYRGWSGASVWQSGTGGSSARIDFTADTSGVYVLEISTTAVAQTGSYTVSVSDFTPAPPASSRDAWRRRIVPLPSGLRSARRREAP